MVYLPEQLEMMLAEEKTKVSELDSQLKSQAHESRMVLEAAERRYEERIAALRADRDAQAERVRKLEDAVWYAVFAINQCGKITCQSCLEALAQLKSVSRQELNIGTQKPEVSATTAQVRCVGCSGILIQQNLCHDCAETTQGHSPGCKSHVYLDGNTVWGCPPECPTRRAREAKNACKHEFEFKRTFNICKHCGIDSACVTSNGDKS